MTTDKNLLADMYDEAANYIEQRGWYQGNLYPGADEYDSTANIIKMFASSQPPACAIGAGYAVQAHNSKFSEIGVIQDFHDGLSSEIGGRFVANWNDEQGRTAEEVIDFLRMTALKIRMGNIGDNPREYEFQPMPETQPVVEPAAPAPTKDPVPA